MAAFRLPTFTTFGTRIPAFRFAFSGPKVGSFGGASFNSGSAANKAVFAEAKSRADAAGAKQDSLAQNARDIQKAIGLGKNSGSSSLVQGLADDAFDLSAAGIGKKLAATAVSQLAGGGILGMLAGLVATKAFDAFSQPLKSFSSPASILESRARLGIPPLGLPAVPITLPPISQLIGKFTSDRLKNAGIPINNVTNIVQDIQESLTDEQIQSLLLTDEKSKAAFGHSGNIVTSAGGLSGEVEKTTLFGASGKKLSRNEARIQNNKIKDILVGRAADIAKLTGNARGLFRTREVRTKTGTKISTVDITQKLFSRFASPNVPVDIDITGDVLSNRTGKRGSALLTPSAGTQVFVTSKNGTINTVNPGKSFLIKYNDISNVIERKTVKQVSSFDFYVGRNSKLIFRPLLASGKLGGRIEHAAGAKVKIRPEVAGTYQEEKTEDLFGTKTVINGNTLTSEGRQFFDKDYVSQNDKFSPIFQQQSAGESNRSAGIRDRSAGILDRSSVIRDRFPGILDRSAGIRDRSSVIQEPFTGIRDRSAGIRDRSSVIQDSNRINRSNITIQEHRDRINSIVTQRTFEASEFSGNEKQISEERKKQRRKSLSFGASSSSPSPSSPWAQT